MNRLTKWIKENVAESIGIVGGIIAIAIIIIFGFILIDNKDKPENPTSEKSAAAGVTASSQQIEKSTTTKDSNTNISLETPDEETKEKEEEKGTSLENESTTLDNKVKNNEGVVKSTTKQPQTKVVNNQTTKANSQQQTSKQPQTTQVQTTKPTTAAPVRGKNGVILEKLYMKIYKNYDLELETVEIPENNKQLIEKTGDNGEGNGMGYQVGWDSLIVKKYANVFSNDIYMGKTKKEDIVRIYGEPYEIRTFDEDGFRTYRYTYRYGKGINSIKDDIYISFDFSVYGSSSGEEVMNWIRIGNGILTFE